MQVINVTGGIFTMYIVSFTVPVHRSGMSTYYMVSGVFVSLGFSCIHVVLSMGFHINYAVIF